LQKKLGKEVLEEFERKCVEGDWVPGIDINGKLVVINTKERKMYEVDLEKLRAGVVEIHDISKPVAFKEDSIRDNLQDIPMSNQLKEVSASEKYAKYLPSKEEIKRIATYIEKTTKMKVSEAFKNGEGTIKIVRSAEANKMEQEELYSILKKLVPNPYILEQLRPIVMARMFYSENVPAFFSASDNSVYLISDNFDQIIKKYCENRGLKMNSKGGRKIEEFLTLFYFIHENIHQTVKENNPIVGNKREDALKEHAKLVSDHSPEKEESAVKQLDSITDRMDALEAYDEGVTHYATHKIMCKLGYAPQAETQIRQLREDKKHVPLHSKGLRFIEAIQVKTHQNPIEYTIKHPPLTMRHIEHPDEYLEYLEKEKIKEN
jgi:Asp-tRNA(Asn)/Glu-tRNA(Gln) amidotransferase C subunit